MILLKGYACALNWPKPKHRPCGDIDIWLFGKQREADVYIAKDKQIEIDNSHHIHSVFEWNGFTVENHYDFINTHAHKSSKELDKQFKKMGMDDSHTIEINGEKVYVPSPNMNALFLLRHAMAHFAAQGINLRQLLDRERCQGSVASALFYVMGYFYHKHEEHLAIRNGFLLVLLGISWAVMAWFWKMHELPPFMKGLPLPETITQYAYRFITAAIAIYLLLVLSPRVLNSPLSWNHPFVTLGKISLGIYAVHFMFLKMWVELFQGMGMVEDVVIACTFIATLAVTWIVVWLLSKRNVTATWLLGKI